MTYKVPHPLDRPYQTEILEWILKSDKKYLILNAPTGFGKSAVAAAISQFYKTLVLVLHKSLQMTNYHNQYAFDILFGKSNYPCYEPAIKNTKFTAYDCDNDDCQCPYQEAEWRCKVSQRVSLNYAKFLSTRSFTEVYRPDFLFLDEGHNLPNIITEFAGISLNYNNKFLQCNGGIRPSPKILTYPEAMTLFKLCCRAMDHNRVCRDDDISLWRQWTRLKQKMDTVNNIISGSELTDWFFETTDKALVIKPLTARRYFKPLFEVADKIVLMSATITPAIVEELGIEDEFDYMTVPSVWPTPTRLVYDLKGPAIHYKLGDDKRQEQIRLIVSVLKSNVSGIIHTMSKAQALDLVDRLSFSSDLDFYVPNANASTERQLQEWYNVRRPGLYCVAWSFQEGVDLGDEDINIVAKVPYASLAGNYNQVKKEYNPAWYLIQTAHRLEQAFGRHQRGIASHYSGQKLSFLADSAWHRLRTHLSEDFIRRIRNYDAL